MTNTNNTSGPCANPDCMLGGIAPSTHTCPDCRKNIHVLCGEETADLHYVLCPVCHAKTRGARGAQQDESKETEEAPATQQQQGNQRIVPPRTPCPAAARNQKRTKPPIPSPSGRYNGTSIATRLSQPRCVLQYHDRLAEFMSFRDGKEYKSPYPYPVSELAKVTPSRKISCYESVWKTRSNAR